MSEEEFYNILKEFTYSDIPYLLSNEYIVAPLEDFYFFTVRKDFTLEGIKYKQGSTISL